MKSTLTKNQKKTFGPKIYTDGGETYKINAIVRYDDDCGNGHNSFSITGEIHRKQGKRWIENSFGCIHDDIAKHFPELRPYIKWHLMSSDGPMHYIANTLYHASDVKDYHHFVYLIVPELEIKELIKLCNDEELEKVKEKFKDFQLEIRSEKTHKNHEADLECARSSAIWPNASLKELQDENKLKDRLPHLIKEFKNDVESLGFVF